MDIRLLEVGEVGLLRDELMALAQYHNAIPSTFTGVYPTVPVDETLEEISQQVTEGRAQVEAMFEGDMLIGFCKASASRTLGVVGLLFVREEFRGKGYGRRLMEGALSYLRGRGVDLIDLRMVAGNPAQALYEKYGFQVRSVIMSRKP